MTSLGLVGVTVPTAPPVTALPAELHVRLADALASSRRLWVRGRLPEPTVLPEAEPERHWWARWPGRSEPAPPIPLLRVETEVGGNSLQTDVAVDRDGRFEVLLEAELPKARRGWRVARHRFTCAGQSGRACGVVLALPAGSSEAAVVLLPLEFTFPAGGPQRLATSDQARQLAPVLNQLQESLEGRPPLYYLAGVPLDADSRQAELALAATTLGWPAGHFVVLPTEWKEAAAAFARGIDRLRWLFAGELSLRVLNLEAAVAPGIVARLASAADRAEVSRVVNAHDNPWAICDRPRTEPVPVAPAHVRPLRAGRVPRYPVVFCHGMLAFSTLRMQVPKDLNCFTPMREFLRARGYRVLFPEVAPTSGVTERAVQLRDQILAWTNEPVNIIAHSMGGLDSRHMISHLGMADRVRTLTTICTGHRGTYVADWFDAHFRQGLPLLFALEALGTNVDGFRDCQVAICRDFNQRTPDMPGVRYFSFGGDVSPARLSPMLRRAWNILTPVEGPNDGLVSVASARWGEYLGTLHVDHFAQTPDAVFVRPGETFDSLGFFARLVEELAWRGF